MGREGGEVRREMVVRRVRRVGREGGWAECEVGGLAGERGGASGRGGKVGGAGWWAGRGGAGRGERGG